MAVISKKICMVGDFGVGKTSLIRRFVERQFSDRYLSTVGVKISRKMLELQDAQQQSQEMKLMIWDIEGQTKFKAIAPSYLQGANGVLVVGDVTRQETLEHLEEQIHKFTEINPQGAVAVAFNKADLLDSEEMAYLQTHFQLSHPALVGTFSTSAKTGKNVDPIFEQLAYQIWHH
ncbi:GTP-binding protein [Spirulina sp. CS-785/01]|uniref:Rab family GTPase n=1 Tax=Spirulina sp. CS-785/01 TaxID=3021716 RepID=UPI00232ECE0B|nr:Rab family GTPase [Spirulina sp. CS-785/01]MDB9313002.1 GTP-binding protein [Spirulina sp. CS-785/01]